MVSFPHTHSKYRCLESRTDGQNDETYTNQLKWRPIWVILFQISGTAQALIVQSRDTTWKHTHCNLNYLYHSYSAVFTFTHLSQDWGGRQWFLKRESHKMSQYAFPLSTSCAVYLGVDRLILVQDHLSGWHLYKKLYRRTCKNKGISNYYPTE